MNRLPGAKVQWTSARHGRHEKLSRRMLQTWVTVTTWQRRRGELFCVERLRREAVASAALNRPTEAECAVVAELIP